MAEDTREDDFTPYSATARFLHWLTVTVLLVMVVTGLVMVYRGKDLNIWDQLTNTLYTTHKTLGLLLLVLIVIRLGYRLMWGAPADDPSLNGLQRFVAHITHWAIYALLIGLPVLGWVGISMFPALGTFGGFKIPALTAPDPATSKQVLWLHGFLAYLLIVLIVMHVAAALYHHTIRRDNVLRRMWPSLKAQR